MAYKINLMLFSIVLSIVENISDAKPLLEKLEPTIKRKFNVKMQPYSYEMSRNYFIKADYETMEGHNLVLEDKEILVNKIILQLKSKEILTGYKNQSAFPAAQEFFQAKPLIEKSKLFEIIKIMPKGAALHLHNSASVSSDWIIKNLTYRTEAEYCYDKSDQFIFTAGEHSKCITTPINIVAERQNKTINQILEYDKWLEQQINMFTNTPCREHKSLEYVWNKFQSLFVTTDSLIRYLPFYKDYHYRMLEEHYEDGVYYIEMRTSFKDLYDKNGNIYDSIPVTRKVEKQFAATHPNFIGLKAIYALYRNLSSDKLQEGVQKFLQLKTKHNDFIIGLDFVGQEDVISLLEISKNFNNKLPTGTKLFLHAGETNWWGTPADMNLIDAVLMNTTRIGHAFALLKHPSIMEMVRKKNIAIEVSVISNQVLHLVNDLRNHPAAVYMALNLPVVITNDDPTFWGAKALSYDWYLAFMAFTPANAGLKVLKQLALNAIQYSYLTDSERGRYSIIFDKAWNSFLDNVICQYATKEFFVK